MGAVTGAMTYGEKKLKDVMEGVLPSRMRSASEAKRTVRQENRRAINSQLNRIDTIDTYLDDPRIEDLIYYPNKDIHYIVLDRRGADNISALMQWAEYRVKKEGITDPHDRYDFVKRIMPDNLIGRHALTHVADVKGFCDGTGGYRSDCDIHGQVGYTYSVSRARRKIQTERDNTNKKYEYMTFFSNFIEKSGQHKALNAAIKKAHCPGHRDAIKGTMHIDPVTKRYTYDYEVTNCSGCTQPRLLYGQADVESWVVDVFFPRSAWFMEKKDSGAFSSSWRIEFRSHHEWGVAALRFMKD